MARSFGIRNVTALAPTPERRPCLLVDPGHVRLSCEVQIFGSTL